MEETQTTRTAPFQEDHLSLLDMARVELTGWIGRTFYRKPPPKSLNPDRMLNLGAGEKLLEGFTNANFFSIREMFRPQRIWMLDLRFPLPCEGNYWDGVFMEHTLEHLYPDQARAVLCEIHRILKPGGWVRISVPDLQKYIQYYCSGSGDPLFARWKFPAEAIHSLTQKYFHYSVWDVLWLSANLKQAGFTEISERRFREGADVRLLRDSADREWESLYMEARKPVEQEISVSPVPEKAK